MWEGTGFGFYCLFSYLIIFSPYFVELGAVFKSEVGFSAKYH